MTEGPRLTPAGPHSFHFLARAVWAGALEQRLVHVARQVNLAQQLGHWRLENGIQQ